MTYPPQPTQGAGQPGPYGQQGQWGTPPQTGHYPGSGPAPQYGGYPGPGGTQQFGQPGQPGPYGQQPVGFPGARPPKKKTGLIVGLSIGAVAVIGGVVALILILSGGDSDGDVAQLEELGEKAVQVLQNKDVDLAVEISCDREDTASTTFEDMPEDVQFELSGTPQINGDTATIPIKVSIQGESRDRELPARKQNGTWCMGE
ncbi:hypothetical protein ABZ863_03745 [Saccharomonospora sp. NPDC046836]|uniref:hypothetical protein n=1 Tax=Saccharomonospora sp. NPDC046836 TaxID=3156921 RepID=UPI0033F26AAB